MLLYDVCYRHLHSFYTAPVHTFLFPSSWKKTSVQQQVANCLWLNNKLQKAMLLANLQMEFSVQTGKVLNIKYFFASEALQSASGTRFADDAEPRTLMIITTKATVLVLLAYGGRETQATRTRCASAAASDVLISTLVIDWRCLLKDEIRARVKL